MAEEQHSCVGQAVTEDTPLQDVTCTRHPGHASFIPITQMNESYLAAPFNTREWVRYIVMLGFSAVRITVHANSDARMGLYSDIPDPPRWAGGTGMAVPVPTQPRPCTMANCRVKGHHLMYENILLVTTPHAVYSPQEAVNTLVEFNFHEDDAPVKKAVGMKMIYRSLADNRVVIKCATHDPTIAPTLDNAKRLRRIIAKKLRRESQGTDSVLSLALLYPHGKPLHVSLGSYAAVWFVSGGDFAMDKTIASPCYFKYTNPLCNGSDGAGVYIIDSQAKAIMTAPHVGFDSAGMGISGMGIYTRHCGDGDGRP